MRGPGEQWCLWLCVSVCLCMSLLWRKTTRAINTELGRPIIHIYSVAGSMHAMTRRSKGQRSWLLGYRSVLPAWVCTSLWLLRFPALSELSALWSDPVCRGCGQSEQACWTATCRRHVTTVVTGFTVGFYAGCAIWLVAATANWVALQTPSSDRMKWGQSRWGQVRWDLW